MPPAPARGYNRGMTATRPAPADWLAAALAALAGTAGLSIAAPATPPVVQAAPLSPATLDIRPDPKGDWGASIPDVEKVLRFAAFELVRHVPDRRLPPVLVEPKGGPIVLYQRGPNGEHQVKLATGGTLWAQYTFQFAHEMGHILCEYDADENPCKWFEESVCEMASLFVLRRSAETWKTGPPYPHWKDYAKHLHSYAEERIQKAALPEGKTLAGWYRENAEALRKNATDRDKNTVVAARLLPLFEAQPSRWQAVGFLNKEKLDAGYDLKRYLGAWHRHCPEAHRAFVREVAKQFEIRIAP